jgi:hypothetical protein
MAANTHTFNESKQYLWLVGFDSSRPGWFRKNVSHGRATMASAHPTPTKAEVMRWEKLLEEKFNRIVVIIAISPINP